MELFGEEPAACLFNQKDVATSYLLFKIGKIEPFPRRNHLSIAKLKSDPFDVHCHCRMSELKDVAMIECSKCMKSTCLLRTSYGYHTGQVGS